MPRPKIQPRRKTTTSQLQIHGEKQLRASESCEDFELDSIQAAEGEAPKLPSFKMTAYTGGKLPVAGWPAPVVVDLSGLKIKAKSIPVQIYHNESLAGLLGHTTEVSINASTIRVSGIQSVPGPESDRVIQAGKNGFPWQVSIGAGVLKASFVDAGEKVEVNGRTHIGPLYVARQSVLKEVSFVATGADGQTSATVEARLSTSGIEKMNPEFKAYLEARDINAESLSEKALAAMQADFEKSLEANEASEDPAPEHDAEAEVKANRKTHADESRRIAAVQKLAGKYPDIEAKAIEEGWDEKTTELAVLKASMPKISHSKKDDGSDVGDIVIEAAFARTLNAPGRDQMYDEKTLEAADKAYRGGIGLCELVAHYASRVSSDVRMRDEQGIDKALRAAFSTTEISSVLSNVGNKISLSAFNAVEQNWRQIVRIGSARDFKTQTKVSLQGDLTFKKVDPSGKIISGDLGNQVYTNKVDTYGRMLVLTREEMRNDDAGALGDVMKKMGRGGALAVNTSVWDCLKTSVTFSATAVTTKGSQFKSNLSATTALTIAGVSTAEGLFDAQVDPDGNPLGSSARYLVTAAVDKATGWNLCNQTQIVSGNTTAAPAGNPIAGRFEHVFSRYLTTSGTWYLLADPEDIAVVEILFLDAQETPLIQSFDTAPDTLGIIYRGVYDFGVAAVEKRGAVKATA